MRGRVCCYRSFQQQPRWVRSEIEAQPPVQLGRPEAPRRLPTNSIYDLVSEFIEEASIGDKLRPRSIDYSTDEVFDVVKEATILGNDFTAQRI